MRNYLNTGERKIIGISTEVVIFSARAAPSGVSRTVETTLTKSTTSNEEFLVVIKKAVVRNA